MATIEELLRAAAERIRRRAQEPAGDAIDDDPPPDPSPRADRPPTAKPERGALRHWSESDPDDHQEEADEN